MSRHKHTPRRLGASLVLAAFATTIIAALPQVALAPPGGGGPTGVIYFHRTIPFYGTELWYMNADGSDKAPLPDGVDGEPSWQSHDGARWFLQLEEIGGGETYPNGDPRVELFAVRENGFAVQLTHQSDLQALGATPRWALDPDGPGGPIVDGVVSWIARHWNETTESEDGGGIYSAKVDYDGTGAIVGLVAQPTAPLVPGESPVSDIAGHDWAPDGISLVYRSAGGAREDGLWVVNDVGDPGGTTDNLTGDRYDPVWSPDGSKIAHKSASTYPAWSIFTINPDGTGQKAVLEITPNTTLIGPRWSPTGSHLLYERRVNGLLGERDVYIAKANGRNKQLLTGDIEDDARPVAWREGSGTSWYCGDGYIDPGEDACNCPEDVPGPPPDEICDDGLDNDCDGLIDCDDPDCGGVLDQFGDLICPIQMCMMGGGNWVNGDGGCKDTLTGLVWSLRTGNSTWFYATQYAADLTEGGYDDWRLATKAELETAYQHMASEQLFQAGTCWSSTRAGNKAWYVNLSNGSSDKILRSGHIPFFCVREAP